MTHSIAKIIHDQGGTRAFAEAVGVEPSQVRLWRFRETFPRAQWLQIATAFPELTLDKLEALEALAKPKATS